jgi:hypothetical protein
MRVRVVLVWMLLALLPVRGWATLVMQLQPPSHHAAMAAQLAPCHDMADAIVAATAATDATAHSPSSAGGSGSHASCSMCDLCHGAAACSAQRAPPLAMNNTTRLRPVDYIDTGRALIGGLERPPRNLPA